MSAYVLLEDGARFDGEACAAPGHAVGEVVFTTGMSGYQECVTEPSFHAQLLTFTAPMVGNYGVSREAMESDRVHARAAIMREAVNSEDAPSAERGWLDWLLDCGVPGITGVDTRALVRHIREAGYESRAENCCFAGRTLQGRVLATVAGGSVVYRERAFALSAA